MVFNLDLIVSGRGRWLKKEDQTVLNPNFTKEVADHKNLKVPQKTKEAGFGQYSPYIDDVGDAVEG
ncbi:unnamed protein product [Dovyalis caffra]|uniref:Uncharacterized protein n=1 Tax=Dovyalis caffra TaxID=77055 RepID=A0AAV1RXC7_9ROSI|nr:unnamed protein product [Dovyalis caffra]